MRPNPDIPVSGRNAARRSESDPILYRIYREGMIRSPYGGRIIGHNINSAQRSLAYLQTTVAATVNRVCGATALESYTLPIEVDANTDRPTVGGDDYRTLTEFENDHSTRETEEGHQSESDQTADSTQYDVAYLYARQSQTDENDDSSSIESQLKNAEEVARERGYDRYAPFADEDESGFSFERSGFQNLLEAVESGPIFLDRINRLGRSTLETIYVAAKLHYEREIPIVTYRHGQYDLTDLDDQIQLVLNAVVAGKSVEDRIRSAWDSIETRFAQKRIWSTWFDKIPIGYESDGNDWVKPTTGGAKVVSAIFNDFIETETYATTADRIQKAATNETFDNARNHNSLAELDTTTIRSVFERSGYEPELFDGPRLRRMVTNPIYIGEIRYPRSADESEQEIIKDPDLKLIDDEIFEKANALTETIANKQATNADESIDTQTLADLGLLLKAVSEIEVFGPICPDCNRGMVRNGSSTLSDGREVHYWMCPKYSEEDAEADVQRKVPYEKEWEALQGHLDEEYTNASEVVALKVCSLDD